jgi:hypothetical protein
LAGADQGEDRRADGDAKVDARQERCGGGPSGDEEEDGEEPHRPRPVGG